MKIIFMAEGATMDAGTAGRGVDQQASPATERPADTKPPGRGNQSSRHATMPPRGVAGEDQAATLPAESTDAGQKPVTEVTSVGAEGASASEKTVDNPPPTEQPKSKEEIRKDIIDTARAAYMAPIEGGTPDAKSAREKVFNAQIAVIENPDSTPEAIYEAYQTLNGAMRYDELGTLLKDHPKRGEVSDVGVAKAIDVIEGWGLLEGADPQRRESVKENFSAILSFDKTPDERAEAFMALRLTENQVPQLLDALGDQQLTDEVVKLVKLKRELAKKQQPPEGTVADPTPAPFKDLSPEEMAEAQAVLEAEQAANADPAASDEDKAKAKEEADKVRANFRKIADGFMKYQRGHLKVGALALGVPLLISFIGVMIVTVIHGGKGGQG